MNEGVNNLIDAIVSGNSQDIDQAFNSEMSARISDKLVYMRQDIAQNLFSEKVEHGGRAIRIGNSIRVFNEKGNHIGSIDHGSYQSAVEMHPLHHLGGEYTHGVSHEPHDTEWSSTIDGHTRKDRDTPEKNRAAVREIRKWADRYKDVNEEVEQIDELSKETLGSYNKAATISLAAAGMGLVRDEDDFEKTKKHQKKFTKRWRGINKVTDKLTKEDVEHLDEGDSNKRLISKHGGPDDEHTAKVYHNREYDEYSVHYYKNGKHMGEGPVGYADNKEDAQAQATHTLANYYNKK